MPLNPLSKLGQFLFRVLQEMGRGAMGFQRGVILVLFIDEESTRLGFMPVDLVHQTSGLFPGFFG
jgi:hypothetical protein